MHSFEHVVSVERKAANWDLLEKKFKVLSAVTLQCASNTKPCQRPDTWICWQRLKLPVKPALAHSVMTAEPDAATTLLQLLYETLEEISSPGAGQTMVLNLNTPEPEPEEEPEEEEEEDQQPPQQQEQEMYEADFLDLDTPGPTAAELAGDPGEVQAPADSGQPAGLVLAPG